MRLAEYESGCESGTAVERQWRLGSVPSRAITRDPGAENMTSNPSALLGPDLRGLVLDHRYRLDEMIGWGGTSNVYGAVDLRLGRPLAVKVILAEHARSEEQRLRIRQEALVGARMEDPHVVPVFDFGEHVAASGEVYPFLVMPRIRGRTLRELILAGPVEWPRALELVRQILAGLATLHRHGVVHRDLKSSNCLVSGGLGQERVQIIDLGLAKVRDGGLVSRAPVSATGALRGTLAYIAPEQARGLPVDARADIYAAGVVLFELLARRLPFSGSDYDVLTAIVGSPAPSLHELAPGVIVPVGLEVILGRALAKEPAERFASAEEFGRALVEVLAEPGRGRTLAQLCCAPAHLGCEEALGSLAAWTCFEYGKARSLAAQASTMNTGWSPLKLLMSLVPDE